MTLELSPDDCRFLQTVLARHLEEMRHELNHTDDRALHREIRADVDRLEQLASRLQTEIGSSVGTKPAHA